MTDWRYITCLLACLLCGQVLASAGESTVVSRPNIVVIVSDDHSGQMLSIAGYPAVSTPNMDRIARNGVLFTRAYASAPTCTASRTGLLTGRHAWNTESAALLHGEWPAGMASYQDLLRNAGYSTGFIGKGWGPGVLNPAKRGDDPTGANYNGDARLVPGARLTGWDLAGMMSTFLDSRPQDKPFSLWIGPFEPHRPFIKASQARFDRKATADWLPGFLPDLPIVREKLAGYLAEVEVLDSDIGRIHGVLEQRGLLDNTLVIITSDNGMDFPRAKSNNYEYGTRVPLIVLWRKGIPHPGRRVDDPVSQIDVTPMILQAAGLAVPATMSGKSILPLLQSDRSGKVDPARNAVFTAFERHSRFRPRSEPTYPRRAIHTANHVLIRNYFPDRWPAGAPPKYKEVSRSWLEDPKTGRYAEPYFTLATAKRPYEELYDLARDPWQHHNRVDDPAYATVLQELRRQLDAELVRTGDPVHLTKQDYFAQFVREDMVRIPPSDDDDQ